MEEKLNKPGTKKKLLVDEMERLVHGTEPKAHRKKFVEYDSMYGYEIGYVPVDIDEVARKFATETVAFCLGPNSGYGGVKKFEEKYDGPDWREIVKKGELYSKIEKLEEKHGYEWSYN